MNSEAPHRPPTTDPDPLATKLRGFGPLGLLAMLVILAGNGLFAPLSALLVLAWVRRSHTPWAEIGYSRPRSWAASVATGLVFGVALKLLMKAVVMPLLGAPPVNQAYQHLQGNTSALPGMLFAVTVGAGFGEETLYRGYLFERLGRLLGRRVAARTAIVLLTSALFGLVHYPSQGLPGVQQALIVGIAFGSVYTVTRVIWMPMLAHAAFDLTALALIYWKLEAAVARYFFG